MNECQHEWVRYQADVPVRPHGGTQWCIPVTRICEKCQLREIVYAVASEQLQAHLEGDGS